MNANAIAFIQSFITDFCINVLYQPLPSLPVGRQVEGEERIEFYFFIFLAARLFLK